MPVSEAGCAKVEKGRSKPRCGADLSNLLQPQETSEMSFPEAAAPGVFVRLQGTSLRAQDDPGSLPQRERGLQGVGHRNHSSEIWLQNTNPGDVHFRNSRSGPITKIPEVEAGQGPYFFPMETNTAHPPPLLPSCSGSHSCGLSHRSRFQRLLPSHGPRNQNPPLLLLV